MIWKDVSSYSRGEKRIPNAWKVRPGMLSLSVHRHIHYPGQWLVSCEPFWSAHPLASADADDAKAEALGMLRRALENALDAIRNEQTKEGE